MNLDKACEITGTGWCVAHEAMAWHCATNRERDRCAKVADKHGLQPQCRGCADQIAQEIRQT